MDLASTNQRVVSPTRAYSPHESSDMTPIRPPRYPSPDTRPQRKFDIQPSPQLGGMIDADKFLRGTVVQKLRKNFFNEHTKSNFSGTEAPAQAQTDLLVQHIPRTNRWSASPPLLPKLPPILPPPNALPLPQKKKPKNGLVLPRTTCCTRHCSIRVFRRLRFQRTLAIQHLQQTRQQPRGTEPEIWKETGTTTSHAMLKTTSQHLVQAL